MPNPQNLNKRVPFKKNDPRINKLGRPKLPDLKEALANILGETKDGKTALDVILAGLRARAAKGDARAAELLLDRAWGKVKQPVDLTTDKQTIIKTSDGTTVII